MPGLLHNQPACAGTSLSRSEVSWQTPMEPASIDLDRPALIDPSGVISHRQLATMVTEQASRLEPSRYGRRLIQLPMVSTRAAVISYLSVLAAGHVALVTGPEANEIRSRYQPDGWLDPSGDVTLADRPQHLLHPELALLLSTSGSTGSPKLVRLSTSNLVSNADAIIAALDLTSHDRTATTLPLTYCFGLSVLHSHLRAGASVVLDPTPVTDPGSTVRLAGHQISTLAVTPHLLEALSLQGALTGGLPRLRLVSQAGGALPPHRVAEIAALGRRHGYGLAVMYGQTEATARMSVLPPELTERYPDSVGWPIAGSEFRVDPAAVRDRSSGPISVDLTPTEVASSTGTRQSSPKPLEAESDRDAQSEPDFAPELGGQSRLDLEADVNGSGQIGELVFSGPGVMLGYAEHPDDLALPRTITELPTGDLGWIDTDGLIRVTGRQSGFVKIMGIRVDLARIERSLAERQIAACVTGDDTTIRVCAATDNTPPAGGARSVDDVEIELRRRVAGLAGVGIGSIQVRFVPQLPLLPSGKLDRRAAADGFPDSWPEPANTPADSAGQPLDQVIAALAPLLGCPDLDPDRSFAELGGDSFTHVQAATRLAQLLAGGRRPDSLLGGVRRQKGERRHPRRTDRSTHPKQPLLAPRRLPSDWHHRSLHQLAELIPAQPVEPRRSKSGTGGTPATTGSRSHNGPHTLNRQPLIQQPAEWLRPIQIETSAVLRAAAVIMICGSHVGLFSLAGGAHILLAVAGFHYTRYIATVPGTADRWRRTGRALIGIGLPALAVAVGMKLLLADGGWPQALLVNSLLQPNQGSIYWFIESLLAALIAVTALLSVPRLQAIARLDLWRFAMALGCLALIPRYLIVGLVDGPVRGLPWTVAWLFLFGMALAAATTRRQQLITAAIAAVATIGFFPNLERNLMIALGLIALGLVLAVPVPRLLAKPIEVLAGASLYVYLIQFPVFRLSGFPPVEFLSALLAGLLFWLIAHPLVRRCQSIISLAPGDLRANSQDRLPQKRKDLPRLNCQDGLRPGQGIFS